MLTFGDTYIGMPVYFNYNNKTKLGYIRGIDYWDTEIHPFLFIEISEDSTLSIHITELEEAKGIY